MKSFHLFLTISFLLFITTLSVQGQYSGNNQQCGPSNPPPPCPPTGANLFAAYTGNVYREIRDLEIWGSAGEIPFVWIRYGNSREGNFKHLLGSGHNWNFSFHNEMSDDAPNSNGQAQIVIHFPEGGEVVFTRDSTDTTVWLPPPAIDKRLFQNGNTFTLQDAKGYRYHFEKLTDNSGGTYYLLEDIRDSQQNEYKFSYDNHQNLDSVFEPAGRYFSVKYDVIGGKRVITKVRSSDGRSVIYNYEIFNDGVTTWTQLSSVSYGDGTQATYNYSQTTAGLRPHLQHAVDPRLVGAAVNMKYSYQASVEGEINQEMNGVNDSVMVTLDARTANKRVVCYSNGRVQTLNLPSNQMGQLNTYTDGLGRLTQYTYDQGGIGFLKSQTDALGRVTMYARTIYGNFISITYPDNTTESWTRDDLDLPLTHTDELGRVTTYARDANHRVIRIAYPDKTFETFTYNDFGEVLDHQRRNRGVEHFLYDSRGLKTSFTDALGNVTAYSYDAADRLACMTDARGNTTCYEYNERGLLTKMTNADSSFQTYTYDDFGNRTTVTYELGHTWRTIYDEFKRPVSKTDPLNRTTLYSYDLPGGICGCSHDNKKPTNITLPSGKKTEITYDVEWQKTSKTVGLGSPDEAITSYEYDMVGNLKTMIDPRMNAWVYEYDLRDRKISLTDPLGNKTQWTYDDVGNNLTVVRPDDGITSNVFDVMNKITQTTNPKTEITKFRYDEEDNLTKLIDANNHNYKFEYDLLNRKTKMIYPGPSNLSESYTYDPVSNLKTYTNRNGDVRIYTYDNRNRETLSDWSDNTPDLSTTYDVASRTLTMISSVSALSYTYDDANEITSETQAVAGNLSKTVSYTYNPDGLRGTMTNPDRSIVSYDYTGRNQVSTIAVDGASPLATYTYDLNGNRILKALENGTATDYGWDNANRDTSIDHKNADESFARFGYGYDNANRRTFVQRDNDKGDVYSYDPIDQVTDVKYDVTDPRGVASKADRIVNYDWDAVGNRNTVTDNGTPTSYTANNLNEYKTVGTNLLMYTANGDLKTFNSGTYMYDAQDRLIRAKNGSATIKFSYDARNRCVKRIINSTATYFYFDNWNLIDERNSGDAQLEHYVNGDMIDEILSKTSSTSSVYYHHDALGSVVKLTDNTGDVVEQYSYDVFGSPTIKNGSGNVISATAYGNRFLFTGREFLAEVGLYDYRNRMFSPVLGTFLQVDPSRFSAMDVNLYRYVSNNSINKMDPSGLQCGGGEDPDDYNRRHDRNSGPGEISHAVFAILVLAWIIIQFNYRKKMQRI